MTILVRPAPLGLAVDTFSPTTEADLDAIEAVHAELVLRYIDNTTAAEIARITSRGLRLGFVASCRGNGWIPSADTGRADAARFQHSLNLGLFGPEGDSTHAGTFHNLNGTMANVDRGTGYIADRLKPTKRSFWLGLPADMGQVARLLFSTGVF
jgi:hypothetical protein